MSDPGAPSAPLRLVVVDDERTLADLLQVALDTAADLACVGVAYDLRAGLELVAAEHPDVVILDVHFPGESNDGVLAAAEIGRRHPGVRTVLLTGRPDRDILRRAADAGVSGLLPKNGALTDLLEAVRTAQRGRLRVHPTLLRDLVGPEASGSAGPSPALSRRELEVLSLMMTGLDPRSIADQLGISVNTSRGYVKSVLRKLQAHSQLEAVAIARRRGLVMAPHES